MNQILKKCGGCNQEMPESKFAFMSRWSLLRRSRCNPCERDRKREYRARKKDLIK